MTGALHIFFIIYVFFIYYDPYAYLLSVSTSSIQAIGGQGFFFPGVFKTVPSKQVLSRSLNPPQFHEIRLTLTPTLQMTNLKFRGNK